MTGKDLMLMGLKPGPIFASTLESIKSMSEDDAKAFVSSLVETQNLAIEAKKANGNKQPFVKPGTWFEWFLDEGRWFVPGFIQPTEPKPSNSDIRRLIENKAIVLNGEAIALETLRTFPINSLVFFPNAKRKTTVW